MLAKSWMILIVALAMSAAAVADEIMGRITSVDTLRQTLVIRPDDRSKPMKKIVLMRGADFRWENGNQSSGKAEWKSVYKGMRVRVKHQSGTASEVILSR